MFKLKTNNEKKAITRPRRVIRLNFAGYVGLDKMNIFSVYA